MNERFLLMLEQLANIMVARGESFRAKAYKKAQETILAMSHEISDPRELKGKPNIGASILDKLIAFHETGTLDILEEEKNNPAHILTEVYGIGPKKAKELIDAGITSIPLLRQNQHLLNDVQKLGLRYYEDILLRIPRQEIDAYKTHFVSQFDGIRMDIVGSYRRGVTTSGDIDVILSCSLVQFRTFLRGLERKGIIRHILSEGASKCLVIAKLTETAPARRVDFLRTDESEYPFAILYFTGSKQFNTAMRRVALDRGFTMNEHEIATKSGCALSACFRTEKDIFDFLGIVYKEPWERIDGRSIEENI